MADWSVIDWLAATMTVAACSGLFLTCLLRIIALKGCGTISHSMSLIAVIAGAPMLAIASLESPSMPLAVFTAGGLGLVLTRTDRWQITSVKHPMLRFLVVGVAAVLLFNGLQYADDQYSPHPPIEIHSVTPRYVDGELVVDIDFTRHESCSATVRWQVLRTNPYQVVWEAEYQAGGTKATGKRRVLPVPARDPKPKLAPGDYRFVYFRTDYCHDRTYEHEPKFVPFEVY